MSCDSVTYFDTHILSLSLSSHPPYSLSLSITSSLSFSQSLSLVVNAYKTFMHARSHLRVQAKGDHANTILSDENPSHKTEGCDAMYEAREDLCL